MSSNDLTTYRCASGYGVCTAFVARSVSNQNLYLCQDHLLQAWSIIQRQIEAGQPAQKLDSAPRLKQVKVENDFPGWVYYLRVGDRIKIGHSMDPDRRLSAYPPGSELIAIRKGSRKMERAEHIRYDVHLAEGREWFLYSDELAEDICVEDDSRPESQADLFNEEKEWERRRAGARPRVEYRKGA